MPTRANKHIKKFNQLVEVYDPEGVELIETVTSRDTETLETRQTAIAETKTQVESLTADSFFDEQRKTEIRETDSLPDPAGVADSQREEMLDRLTQIEESIAETLSDGPGLDTDDDLGF